LASTPKNYYENSKIMRKKTCDAFAGTHFA